MEESKSSAERLKRLEELLRRREEIFEKMTEYMSVLRFIVDLYFEQLEEKDKIEEELEKAHVKEDGEEVSGD